MDDMGVKLPHESSEVPNHQNMGKNPTKIAIDSRYHWRVTGINNGPFNDAGTS